MARTPETFWLPGKSRPVSDKRIRITGTVPVTENTCSSFVSKDATKNPQQHLADQLLRTVSLHRSRCQRMDEHLIELRARVAEQTSRAIRDVRKAAHSFCSFRCHRQLNFLLDCCMSQLTLTNMICLFEISTTNEVSTRNHHRDFKRIIEKIARRG